MTLSVEDDSDNETKPDDSIDDESEPKSVAFDVDNSGNIFAIALHWAALAKVSSEAGAENWFEAVNIKSKICNLCNATVYQEIFGSSRAWEINTHLFAHNCQTMYTENLQMISNFINRIHTGINTTRPVNFPGLPEDEQFPTDDVDVHFTNDQQDCYTVLILSAMRME